MKTQETIKIRKLTLMSLMLPLDLLNLLRWQADSLPLSQLGSPHVSLGFFNLE